jgi:hypothetical protein
MGKDIRALKQAEVHIQLALIDLEDSLSDQLRDDVGAVFDNLHTVLKHLRNVLKTREG